MLICVGMTLTSQLQLLLLGDNVVYRPDIEAKAEHAAEAMFASIRPDVYISRALPPEDCLRVWRASVPMERKLLLVCISDVASLRTLEGVTVQEIDASVSQPEIEAFKIAEHFFRPAGCALSLPPPHPAKQRVLLIGAGAVNLVTAVHLANSGFEVELLDAGADPRKPHDWREQGCTLGGEDGRIFSLNESRQHHFKGIDVPKDGARHYRTDIAKGGWLYKESLALSPQDQSWIREAERVPTWLLQQFNQEIISFNRESEGLWRHLMSDYPELFADVGLYRRLLRLYASRERFEKAVTVERGLGSVREELSLSELASRYPALEEAVLDGHVEAALEVVGFSVNIHRFCRSFVAWLEEHGALFRWNTRASELVCDGAGAIRGVRTTHGVLEADHFVASLGAFPRQLDEQLDSRGQIKPMIGMWLTLPDSAPELDVPIKVSRKGFASGGAAEGANVIAGVDGSGRRVIHLSSGHGFIGTGEEELDMDALAELSRAVVETARELFPSKFARAQQSKLLSEVRRYCIRPWTASGLGLFETKRASRGLFVLTGGHNTGGFAQSPAIARAVENALTGREHAMHTLYHPLRLTSFTGTHLGAT